MLHYRANRLPGAQRPASITNPKSKIENSLVSTDRILTVVLCGIVHDGRWLLIKRSKPPYEGYWGLVGGKMEPGETVAEAAEREAMEETRLPAKFDRLKGVVNETLTEGERVAAHFVLFVCRLRTDGHDHAAGEEGQLRWFTPEDIRAERPDVIPTDYRMIESLLLRPDDDAPFVEASMREDAGRYEVLRFDAQ